MKNPTVNIGGLKKKKKDIKYLKWGGGGIITLISRFLNKNPPLTTLTPFSSPDDK